MTLGFVVLLILWIVFWWGYDVGKETVEENMRRHYETINHTEEDII